LEAIKGLLERRLGRRWRRRLWGGCWDDAGEEDSGEDAGRMLERKTLGRMLQRIGKDGGRMRKILPRERHTRQIIDIDDVIFTARRASDDIVPEHT
jgi:hypothetical protein